MRTMIVLLISTAVTALFELWVGCGMKNGVEKFVQEVKP